MASSLLRSVVRRRESSLLPLFQRSIASLSSSKSSASSAVSSSSIIVPDEKFLKYSSPVPVALDHTQFLSEIPTRITTLSNGLRVATQEVPQAETATVGVWISAGSRFETTETSGTAHFLEHLLFKGTSKRNSRQLEEQMESIGGHLDAYTSREQTTYYSRVLKNDLALATEVIADMLQNSSLSKHRIEDERSTVLREMAEVGKNEQEMLFDHLHATAFQYTPLGRTILGSAENISTISREDLEVYIKSHYTAPRMVLSAAGAVNHEEMVSLAEKNFSSLSSDATPPMEIIAKNPTHFTGSEIRIRDDDMPLAHIVLAFGGASWTDPDSVTLMVMQAMLGSWEKTGGAGLHAGSELAQTVASNGLAERYSAFNTNYMDAGLFGVVMEAKPENLDDLAWTVMHELTKMVYRVSEDDVTRAKNQLKSSIILHNFGSVQAVAEDIGRQMLCYGRRLPLAETFARIDAVDAETVKRVAERFIYDKDFALASMGPTQYLPDYNWFRRRTFWLKY